MMETALEYSLVVAGLWVYVPKQICIYGSLKETHLSLATIARCGYDDKCP